MAKSITIELPDIGTIVLEKSSRARHVSISVRPVLGVRVAVPQNVSFDHAKQVARNNAGWIYARLKKVRKAEEKSLRLLENRAYISRAAAKGIILARLEELAGIHSISYNKVFIRDQKTRWGSCSAKKNLNFNYKIALLPRHLMDYVLLHELVHIKHLNHSRQFWDELNRLAGDDAASLDKQLNEFSALLV